MQSSSTPSPSPSQVDSFSYDNVKFIILVFLVGGCLLLLLYFGSICRRDRPRHLRDQGDAQHDLGGPLLPANTRSVDTSSSAQDPEALNFISDNLNKGAALPVGTINQ